MIKRKYMRTRQLKPGMKLDHPVVDRLGRNLVARGAELDEYMIDSMIKMGIMTVYIQDGEITDEVEQKLEISYEITDGEHIILRNSSGIAGLWDKTKSKTKETISVPITASLDESKITRDMYISIVEK